MRRYIDADAFAEKMKRQYCENCDKYQGIRCNSCSCGDWLDDLYFEPAADVRENVRGEWIKPISRGDVLSYGRAYYECDQCHKVAFFGNEMNFCPNCGADMRSKS